VQRLGVKNLADHLGPVISKMEEMGITIIPDENGVQVIADKPLRAVDLKTLPYPGFPTDMQAQMMALMLASEGTSIISETVFENRFMHVDEFNLMNAGIRIEGRTSIVTGGASLVGAKVCSTDLRAGAALICAGLISEGTTEVSGTHHIDRGYVHLAEKLSGLGADIWRLEEAEPSQEPTPAVEEQMAAFSDKTEKVNTATLNVQPTLA